MFKTQIKASPPNFVHRELFPSNVGGFPPTFQGKSTRDSVALPPLPLKETLPVSMDNPSKIFENHLGLHFDELLYSFLTV